MTEQEAIQFVTRWRDHLIEHSQDARLPSGPRKVALDQARALSLVLDAATPRFQCQSCQSLVNLQSPVSTCLGCGQVFAIEELAQVLNIKPVRTPVSLVGAKA